MTTILEALENAQCNLETCKNMGMGSNSIFMIAKSQLDNALKALEKEDANINDDMNNVKDADLDYNQDYNGIAHVHGLYSGFMVYEDDQQWYEVLTQSKSFITTEPPVKNG